MINLCFIASDNLDLEHLNDVSTFVDNYPGLQSVAFNNEDELELLLELMGIREFSCIELSNTAYSRYWDLSHAKFPEFDNTQFDQFYENWIEKSNRENSMDEYGSLIFLTGLSSEWNKLKYRFVVQTPD
jgi:hypothetical protein